MFCIESLESVSNIKPIFASKEAIESLAESIAIDLNFSPGDDIEDVVIKLGGRITTLCPEKSLKAYSRLLQNDSSLIIENESNFVISLTAFNGATRDRFIIAHELGHYFIHSAMGEIVPMIASRSGSNRAEREANWFAAAFLMPKEKFIQLSETSSITQIAAYFRVSLNAVKARAQRLNIELKSK